MKRDEIKDFFKSWYNGEFKGFEDSKLLVEQEEEDIFADEEPAEEGGDEEPEEADEDSEDEEETKKDTSKPDEEKIAIEAGDEVRYGKQFDIALDSILADYEMNALKSAQINADALDSYRVEEWYSQDLSKLLFEQEESTQLDFDVDLYSEDVARLINNYDSLMDMESIIFNKAKEFLILKHGEDVADAFSEALRMRHGLVFDREIETEEDIEDVAPLAVGAGGGDGAA
jgi:hypothetical protein